MDELRHGEWRRLRGPDQAQGIKRLRWALMRNPWNTTPREHNQVAPTVYQEGLLSVPGGKVSCEERQLWQNAEVMRTKDETGSGEWFDSRFWKPPVMEDGVPVDRLRVPVDEFGVIDGLAVEGCGRWVLRGEKVDTQCAAKHLGVSERFLRHWVVQYQHAREAARRSRPSSARQASQPARRQPGLTEKLEKKAPGWWTGGE